MYIKYKNLPLGEVCLEQFLENFIKMSVANSHLLVPSITEKAEVPCDPITKSYHNNITISSHHLGYHGDEDIETYWAIPIGLLILLTCLFNVLVVIITTRDKHFHSVTYLYVTSLAVADLFVGSIVMNGMLV